VPLYQQLAAAGHTAADPARCEVSHALVMLRRLTGEVPANSKFPEDEPTAVAWLDRAEAQYEADRHVLRPVAVL